MEGNNTNNAWDNGANYWNTTKQAGTNIIGGPYIGGNYWSDNPNSTDVDDDGIGDVAYDVAEGTNKDYLPLVTKLPMFIGMYSPPEVIDPEVIDLPNSAPWEFDLIVSNGTWRREIKDVTHFVTEMPGGNSVLQAHATPVPYETDTIDCCLPIFLEVREVQFISIYVQKKSTLQPFTFSVLTEHPSAKSSYSGLTHNATAKKMTVNVSTQVDQDWWGCFVLPKNLTVRTLTAYAAGVSYQLGPFLNYTSTLVDEYNIIVPKLPPEEDDPFSLVCTYTVFGDITGDGTVDIRDIALVATAYESYPSHPRWKPVCDINYDFKVNIIDIATIAKQFGKKI